MAARWIAGSMLVAAALASSSAQAFSTSAHAMIVSGIAQHPGGGTFDCATSGPQPGVLARFGTGVGLPTEGYAYCNLAGAIKDTTSTTGVSTASESLSNSFGSGTHLQTADAVADIGVLKVSSNGSYTGDAIGGFAYHAGEAAAVSSDTLPTPAGVAFIQFGLTIDGAAAVARTSQILTFLNYQINSGPVFGVFTGDLIGDQPGGTAIAANILGQQVAGFTVVPGSLSGMGTVFSFRSDVPVGPTFDLTLGLYAASYPSPFGGVANNDFSETARLSSILMFDAAGNPVNFGTITGASGRLYDADGVHTAAVGGVPEPATWALLLAGFGLTGAALRRRSVQPG